MVKYAYTEDNKKKKKEICTNPNICCLSWIQTIWPPKKTTNKKGKNNLPHQKKKKKKVLFFPKKIIIQNTKCISWKKRHQSDVKPNLTNLFAMEHYIKQGVCVMHRGLAIYI